MAPAVIRASSDWSEGRRAVNAWRNCYARRIKVSSLFPRSGAAAGASDGVHAHLEEIHQVLMSLWSTWISSVATEAPDDVALRLMLLQKVVSPTGDASICSAIIHMAHSSNLWVMASEGVEQVALPLGEHAASKHVEAVLALLLGAKQCHVGEFDE